MCSFNSKMPTQLNSKHATPIEELIPHTKTVSRKKTHSTNLVCEKLNIFEIWEQFATPISFFGSLNTLLWHRLYNLLLFCIYIASGASPTWAIGLFSPNKSLCLLEQKQCPERKRTLQSKFENKFWDYKDF